MQPVGLVFDRVIARDESRDSEVATSIAWLISGDIGYPING
jgi:hypothetical protein